MKACPCLRSAVVAVALVSTLSFPATAQTFEDVHRCDELAAHPDDPNRRAEGLYDDAIVPGPAIQFCSDAVQSYPDAARFHFQHGRALWAGNRYDEAVEAFLRAEEMSYGPAYAYLGDAHFHGLGGVEKDENFAVTLYQTAAEAGFQPAEAVLAEIASLQVAKPPKLSLSEKEESHVRVRLRAQALSNYLGKNGKLPDSYITKREAGALGWDAKKGNLHIVAPGSSIGGDKFLNREGQLPTAPGRTWREADIGYKSGFRNANRVLYSNDGLVYFTSDHYATFEKIK